MVEIKFAIQVWCVGFPFVHANTVLQHKFYVMLWFLIGSSAHSFACFMSLGKKKTYCILESVNIQQHNRSIQISFLHMEDSRKPGCVPFAVKLTVHCEWWKIRTSKQFAVEKWIVQYCSLASKTILT